jgi:hypothetical protein
VKEAVSLQLGPAAALHALPAGNSSTEQRQLKPNWISFALLSARSACRDTMRRTCTVSSTGQLLAVKVGLEEALERLDPIDDQRVALDEDRDALSALADPLAKVWPNWVSATPATSRGWRCW